MAHKKISQILLDLREKHNLKQKDIAKVLGISQQTYSNYERGLREIPVHHLKALAEFYNTSLDFILDTSIILPGNADCSREFADGISMHQVIYDLDQLSRPKKLELLRYLNYLKRINP